MAYHTRQQQREQQLQRQLQQDWDDLLSNVVIPSCPAGLPGTTTAAVSTPCALHRVSSKQRGAARATIRHLCLFQYMSGRTILQRVAADPAASRDATAASAATPPIPWAALAAMPCLTSLTIAASQAQQLMGQTSAAAAAAADAAAPEALTALWHRLRDLRVVRIREGSELLQLGQLLRGATQLTKLVLQTDLAEDVAHLDCTHLVKGLALAPVDTAAAPAPAPAVAAAAQLHVAGAPSSRPGVLPRLQRLGVQGTITGVLAAFLGSTGAAQQLTCLHLVMGASWEPNLKQLAACSGLRELVLNSSGVEPVPAAAAFEGLDQLTGLSSLELCGCNPRGVLSKVWALSQLRDLCLSDNPDVRDTGVYGQVQLPSLQVLKDLDHQRQSFRLQPIGDGQHGEGQLSTRLCCCGCCG